MKIILDRHNNYIDFFSTVFVLMHILCFHNFLIKLKENCGSFLRNLGTHIRFRGVTSLIYTIATEKLWLDDPG